MGVFGGGFAQRQGRKILLNLLRRGTLLEGPDHGIERQGFTLRLAQRTPQLDRSERLPFSVRRLKVLPTWLTGVT